MADTSAADSAASKPADKPADTPAPTVVLSGEQHARQQLADEMKALAANPLDEQKVAGGVYRDAGGTGYHNAHGEAVTAQGKPVK